MKKGDIQNKKANLNLVFTNHNIKKMKKHPFSDTYHEDFLVLPSRFVTYVLINCLKSMKKDHMWTIIFQ